MCPEKVGFEETLANKVVSPERCVGCGACVVVCPFGCLEYTDEKPRLVKECKLCGLCAKTCPRYDWSLGKAEAYIFGRERKPEEVFGVYRRIAVAQATDPRVLGVRQDGGVATMLLLYAIEKGLIDGAIVSSSDPAKPFYPIAKLATSPGDILAAAGTKYFCSPNLLPLAEVVAQKKQNIALVGTPCKIHAVRSMQMAGIKKPTAPVKFLIGLMCSECFTYNGLMLEHIQKKLGINLAGIRKMNIKGKMLITTDAGVTPIPLAEIKQFTRRSCSICKDFSSELADVSGGGLGLDGWTFTIIRTERGEELFSAAERAGYLVTKPLEEGSFAMNLLMKLSKKKREGPAVAPQAQK